MEFIKNILKVGCEWDCNNGEILDGIGRRLGICYCCRKERGPADFEGDDEFCKICK